MKVLTSVRQKKVRNRRIEKPNINMLKAALLIAAIVQLTNSTQILRGQSLQSHNAHLKAATHALKNKEEPDESGYGDEEESAEAVNAEMESDDESTDETEDETDTEETGDKFEDKFASQGEKNWHVPTMKALGFFKGEAGLNADGLNKTILETTFKPTMIPTDGFAIKAATPLATNDTKLSPFVPKTVPHGELKEIRAKEDEAEDSEVEGDIKMKHDELKNTQASGACALMTNALELARAARAEEEAAKGEGKALVDIVKMVCPSLKFRYSFVMRCKQCEKMVARLEKFYVPEFDTKVFPGLAHPNKCDKEKWPTKNFGK